MKIMVPDKQSDSGQDEKNMVEGSKDDVKQISHIVQKHIEKIQNENLKSFQSAGNMYKDAFHVGIGLIVIGFILAISTVIMSNAGNEQNNQPDITLITGILSGIFGAGGIIDITMLLFRPARDLQRSRASASQLAMATNEWQFISIWSGKTISSVYKKLEKQQCDLTCINTIKELLILKEKLCSNLINTIEQTVANETVEEGKSSQLTPQPQVIIYDIEITDQDKLKSMTDWVKKVNEKANETCKVKDKEFIKITDDKKNIVIIFVDEKEKKCIVDAMKENEDECNKIDSEFYKKLLEKTM